MAKNFEKLFKAKAYKIWQKRQIEGREGNSNDDWEEAKNLCNLGLLDCYLN